MRKSLIEKAENLAETLQHYKEHRNEISLEIAQSQLRSILEDINEHNKKTKRN
jgi:ribosomal protein S15P/S13E